MFFLSELSTTIAYDLKMNFFNFSLVFKALFAAFVALNFLKNIKTYKKPLLFLIAMTVIFFIGQLSFNDFLLGPNFIENCIYFGRYLFVFFIMLFLMNNKHSLKTQFYKVYEIIVIFNCIIVITTIVFDLPIFKTYYYRFGSSGAFMTPSIITYFNAIALIYFIYQFLFKKKKLIELILVSVVCFLTGTKAMIFFFVLSIIHVILLKKLYTKRNFYFFLFGILVILFLAKDKIAEFIYENFKPLIEVYREHGVVSALTSLRDVNFRNNFLPVLFEKWNWLNYLFGGTDFEIYRVEFEIFDVFLYFGIIGMLLYLIYYFKEVLNFNRINHFGKIQISILILTAIISGNFLNNAPIALYLMIVLSVLRNDVIKE
ncbi:hypothetical protein [Winogradskyella sediminis]|uniref:hypothetical protein n=1 Tax=Winogradskyella sediminis TaxID=1382466 RepID=UPI003AA994E0